MYSLTKKVVGVKNTSNLIFGCRPIIETILSGRKIKKIIFLKKNRSVLKKSLYDLCHKHKIPFSYVPIEKLNSRIAKVNHQGVIAVISPISFTSLDLIIQTTFKKKKNPLIIVLDGVTDVHNMGAIARTALSMGVDALVLPYKGSAELAGTAMKTSAGALATLPICRVFNLNKALNFLQEKGLILLACYAHAAKSIHEIDLNLPLALILGNENNGIASQHLKLVNHHIGIPMQGCISSLNVSVAAGIILYEVFRQRFLIQKNILL